MPGKSGRVTLEDVAKATGFTINTVSRALKNKPDISRQTCEAIQQKAREMGYVRNYIASSLRSGRTKTIALIAGTMSNPFYAVLADVIQREAFRLGYSLMILCSQDDPGMEVNMVNMALSRQVDGVLVIPWSDQSPAMEQLRGSGVPYVVLNRFLGEDRDDCVLCDEENGGYLVGRHLIEAGHRKLAMLSHRDVLFSTRQRFQGFLRAGREAGLPDENMIYGQSTDPEEIIRFLKRWKEEGVTGIFSFCDVEAWEELSLIERCGFRIPEDFSVVGFDNISGYVAFPRPICSVDCSFQEEAVQAIDLLRNRIHHPELPPQHVILPVSLICRDSCR
ncbi:MAG: LacI family transcriptional regulator [Clostridiales bacterium]|nr:LacI family transcriptional regulator [Clostridiales bacterium]